MYLTETEVRRSRVGLLMLLNQGVDEDQKATDKRLSTRTITTKQEWEEILTHSGLGLFGAKGQGEAARMDESISRFDKQFKTIIYELGVEYTGQAKYRDVYGFIRAHGKMMAAAARITRNFNAAMAIQLGFSGGGVETPDGEPVFSTAHPLATGETQSNVLSSDLGGLEIEEAVGLVGEQLGDRGLPVSNAAERFKLIVAPRNRGRAIRVAKSEKLAGTMDNDTNEFIADAITQIIPEQFIGWGDEAMRDSWYLLPDKQDENPLFCLRSGGDFEERMDRDVYTGNYVVVASFEEAWHWLDWRNVIASNP